jgi:hypothetical protein
VLPTCPVTVAVKVTADPEAAGFCDEDSAVDVGARFTTCATALDLLDSKIESPAYSAFTLSVPPVKLDVIKAAEPPLNGADPSVVVPCTNAIISPSGGEPILDVTVAVKVTDWP